MPISPIGSETQSGAELVAAWGVMSSYIGEQAVIKEQHGPVRDAYRGWCSTISDTRWRQRPPMSQLCSQGYIFTWGRVIGGKGLEGLFSLFCISLTVYFLITLKTLAPALLSALLSGMEHSAFTTYYLCPACGSVAKSGSAPAHGHFLKFVYECLACLCSL